MLRCQTMLRCRPGQRDATRPGVLPAAVGQAAACAILAFCSATFWTSPVSAADAPAGRDTLGVAAYTFRNLSFLEAIEKTADLGVRSIEAFGNQRLAPDSDVTVGSDLSAADLARIHTALEKHGLTLTSIYIHALPGNPETAAEIFERVKRLGAGLIVAEPASGDLDVIEPLCDRYGIDLALHNHATDKSEYHDPRYLATVLSGRGPRIGACCDTGHWQRRGLDPVEGLRTLAGRIFSLHLKDLDAARPDVHDVPWGTGRGRVADVFAELERQGARPRIVAIEYEHDVGRSLPQVEQCVAFYRSGTADTAAADTTVREPPAGLRVGWAVGDITPDQPVSIQGQHYLRISERVRDPLTCTALAFESVRDGGSVDQAVLVSCDLCSISPELLDALATHHESIRQQAPGLDPARIVLNATHTHTGPRPHGDDDTLPPHVMRPPAYRAFAAERIADAVVAAWNARSPAAVSWALSHADVARNRRVVYFDPVTGLPAAGRTTMYGKTTAADFDSIEGPADTGLGLVFFWKPDGTLSGLIVNLPCPSQESANDKELSADFWCETRAELRQRLGADVHVLAQCAAAGDCTSRDIWRTAAEQEMRRRRGLSTRAEVARRIANGVSDVMPIAREGLQDDPVVAHAIRTLELPKRLVTLAERERCLADAEQAKTPEKRNWHLRSVRRFDEEQEAITRGEHPTAPITVHAIRLGDVAFVTNSFELFGDYGTRMQARSPAPLTCIVQLAGRGTPGTYLPTVRAVEGAGYSAVIESNIVGPAGGRMLVDESVKMLQDLWATSQPGAAAVRP